MVFKISVIRGILAVINSTLAILGIALIALSLFELNNSEPGTLVRITSIFQIFIGSFVILTSFLGCFGSCRYSLGITWSYGICIATLLIFQIYILVVAHANDYVRSTVNKFDLMWSNIKQNAYELAQIEQKFQCCGRLSFKDYLDMGNSIPKHCYLDLVRKAENIFDHGCLERLRTNAGSHVSAGLMVKWILFAMELMAVGCSTVMIISLRHKQRRDNFID